MIHEIPTTIMNDAKGSPLGGHTTVFLLMAWHHVDLGLLLAEIGFELRIYTGQT